MFFGRKDLQISSDNTVIAEMTTAWTLPNDVSAYALILKNAVSSSLGIESVIMQSEAVCVLLLERNAVLETAHCPHPPRQECKLGHRRL